MEDSEELLDNVLQKKGALAIGNRQVEETCHSFLLLSIGFNATSIWDDPNTSQWDVETTVLLLVASDVLVDMHLL